MRPVDIIANAAHEYSATLPKTSEDRALLFSRRHGFAEAAMKALYASGYRVVAKDAIGALEQSAHDCGEIG